MSTGAAITGRRSMSPTLRSASALHCLPSICFWKNARPNGVYRKFDTMLIDTHCHLDYLPFSPRLPEILTSASNCGVLRFIVPGVEPRSWERIISLSREDERIFAAPGV